MSLKKKLAAAGLELIISSPMSQYILWQMDGMWRVIDNLMNNICKYAQTGSRVYVNLKLCQLGEYHVSEHFQVPFEYQR